ncbi:major facilitator superfamily protein [Trichomonas vaginalis G3]|uniref:Major facilitator superfamily protein n=1 Tax=Trichomonas vaginalis (strain ATCC PRA-98 / G3) TaxID=412133 RepID=A2EQH6_TRIV3|nr:major facilitator superfamily transporter [Trichomonas vaginalis G3]EAY05118.1 major facilitator superfamily protein [Trichomonas vaginalis G3]KAI5551455.1 glucose import [Trichomonas vaginalis G3]|eukprot:XP_001317341.1 major facilitator superfamily transporter [Trichomonas vaginalis G3]
MPQIPKISNPYVCGILLTMGGVDMGFGLVYTSFTLTAISNKFDMNKLQSTWFTCIGLLAAMVAALIINPFVNRYGKRWTGFITAIYGVFAWVILGLSTNKAMVFVFRALSGMTVGFYSTICPTFIAEVAPVERKFLFGFMNQIGIAIGFLIVTVLGIYVSWQAVSIICAFPSFILACSFLFIPEPEIAAVTVSCSHLLKFKKELFIAFLCMFFLQFSGINAVMSNMQIIITNAKLTISTSLIGILTNVIQLISTILSAIVVDKLGHRICWIISSLGQLISFVLLCLHQKVNLPSWVFMIGLFLEQLTYGIGTGPIPFAAAANLFRVELCANAMAVSTAENWLLSTIVCLIWPYLESGLTLGYAFLFFVGIQVLAIIFGVIVFKPKGKEETKDDDVSSSSQENEEAENMSRRLSHAKEIPEL